MFKLGRVSPPFKDWKETEVFSEEDQIHYPTGEYELVDDIDKEVWEVWIDHVGKVHNMSGWDCMIQVRGETEEMAMFLANEIVNRLNDPKVLMKRNLKVGE